MQMLFFLAKKLIIHVESGIDPNCKVILEVTFLTKYSYNYLFLLTLDVVLVKDVPVKEKIYPLESIFSWF